jgi:hypothetical protein
MGSNNDQYGLFLGNIEKLREEAWHSRPRMT